MGAVQKNQTTSLLRGAGHDDLASLVTTFGAEINDPVGAVMLLELQKVEKEYGDISKLIKNLIRSKYEKMCA